ncbi:hypothetical protein GH714_023472 [Hevea brasiliensis]|uniref:glycerophosphodiester phosphodiesterase n=1 Tax=Hevea brasiliensis TaxID=3981 RepID=A0A6A6LTI2_HEVBR|nr:hypothetical protein GH714_023472 [Hevea brasiliensis]
MSSPRAFTSLLPAFLLLHSLVTLVSAQGSTSRWQTLSGNPPLVVARGGFSGLFPDSSYYAYQFALETSVPDVILWCDVQLTKDGVGICAPDLRLENSTNISILNKYKTYLVNGVPTRGCFSVDFTFSDLSSVVLDYYIHLDIVLWILLGRMDRTEKVVFLRSIAARVNPNVTKLVFRFLGPNDFEPSTNQTYSSLLKNLTFIKTFASGILIPKGYIWPVDASLYLQPHTSVVLDAHKAGLEVFASEFYNDVPFSFNYSYDPVSEYLSFIDNGDFSVDAKVLVISKNGASGDYPGCTDKAYQKAISDGADVIDCPVQMSKDGIPFCLGSINLIDTAMANPYAKYELFRNPKFRNDGKFLSLSDFLALAKNSSSLSGVLISIENASYLIEKQQLPVTDAVLDALSKAGYDKQNAMELMIQSNVVPRLKSAGLPVYVETFSNEFVSQAWDFFSDANVEVNTYVMEANVNGVITDFPLTASRYKRNHCLNLGKNTPPYMTPVPPGGLMEIIPRELLPPAEAPNPVLTENDVAESPLPSVIARVPSSSPGDGTAQAAAPRPNGQHQIAACFFLTNLAILFTVFSLL